MPVPAPRSPRPTGRLAVGSGPAVATPVLADALPAGRLAALTVVLAGAAVIGLCAQVAVPLPGTPVPFTLQTFAVLVVAAALGPRRGVAAVALYVGAGVAGVPWFAPVATGATAGRVRAAPVTRSNSAPCSGHSTQVPKTSPSASDSSSCEQMSPMA